jgi:uncharacterized protein (DUF58 family)
MLPPEVVRQIRRLQLRARRAVEDLLGGEYHSAFKGTGLAFEEVRAYQPGDDVRAIDWNVTARMGQPFIKRFVEERELTVLFLVDASGSLAFGTRRQPKREVAAELAALLAFSAIHNNDRVGLVHFTNRVEQFLPPRKGARHAQRLIRDVLFFRPQHRGTGLRAALDFLNRVQRRRAVVFLLSDFRDSGYERALRYTGRRHDLIALCLRDPAEEELPAMGLLELADAETDEPVLVDTSSPALRAAYAATARRRRADLQRLARAAAADLVEVSTDGDHLEELIGFFRRRERRLRRP